MVFGARGTAGVSCRTVLPALIDGEVATVPPPFVRVTPETVLGSMGALNWASMIALVPRPVPPLIGLKLITVGAVEALPNSA